MVAPHLKELSIRNYRVFSEFEIGEFRRINLIAGLNGTGKTTLLEAIFFLMDRGNIISLLRPLQWRSLPPTLSYAKAMFFSDGTLNELSIRGRMREGTAEVLYRWEPQRLPENQSVPISSHGLEARPTSLDAQTDSGMDGFTVEVKRDNVLRLRRGMIQTIDGFQGYDILNQPERAVVGILLNRYTMHFANDISQKYSEIVRKGKKPRVLDMAKRVNDQIDDLELLQVGAESILHVRLVKGDMVPINLAGDGVLTLLSIGLSIMNAEKGVVILDEFDAAIHFSVLPEVWKFISELSLEYDCQIFSATHSRECIEAAVKGVSSHNRAKDIAYYRLDKIENSIKATRYASDELVEAGISGWEIR